MKKTNLFFFALFIAANVFVGCDRSLYDAPVVEQTKSIKASNVDRGEAVSFWYGGKKMCLTPDYSSSFIVYNSDKNVVASHKILSEEILNRQQAFLLQELLKVKKRNGR